MLNITISFSSCVFTNLAGGEFVGLEFDEFKSIFLLYAELPEKFRLCPNLIELRFCISTGEEGALRML